MATAFIRTMRSLEADRFQRTLVFPVIFGGLVAIWCGWFFLARIERYEVSNVARLETDQGSYVLQSPTSGRVTSIRLLLGQPVEAGDVLVQLDSNRERLQLAEERARLAALNPELEAHHKETGSLEQARLREHQATSVAVQEALAHYHEAEARARYATNEAKRLKSLRANGLIPEREYAQGDAEAMRREAASEGLKLVAARLESEQATRDSDRDASVNHISAEIESLRGQTTTIAAAIDRLQYDIERRVIRAPARGRLADVAVLRIGAFVQEGDKIGSIVPEGTLRVVAEFLPAAALGRIHPGQRARLRLQGFPWAQYGTIGATVASVGGEIRDGRVRVELNVNAPTSSSIPLQHGMPGEVEIEVERISPATLILRAAGRLVAAPRSTFTSGPP
jgi:multidrug resistance efflux pump